MYSYYLSGSEKIKARKRRGDLRGLGRVSKDSNEIPRFRFTGILDLAGGSTKEAKRMQLGSSGMHPFCMGHKAFLHAQCRRERERERGTERERGGRRGRGRGPRTPSPRLLHFGDELSFPSATRNSRPSVLRANSRERSASSFCKKRFCS